MEITTQRLLIRNLLPNDLLNFHQYRSNPDVCKYQGFNVMNQQEAMEFIIKNKKKTYGKPGEWVQYAIELKEEEKLIGDCAIKLHKGDPRIASIGMTVSNRYQKNGFAKEAMLGILQFLFNQQNIHRIEETLGVDNEASVRLLESLGFRKEGHFIKNVFFKGKWDSEYMYAMLREEWMG